MPSREAWTYGCGVLGVTLDSDVTHRAKEMTNAGTAADAGLVPGAWQGQPGDPNSVVGECGLSRSRFAENGSSRMQLGGVAARQWGFRLRVRVVPSTSNDERTDGLYVSSGTEACRLTISSGGP